MSLNSDDPVVAVIIERLSRMQADAERDRQEIKAQFTELREDMAERDKTVSAELGEVKTFMSNAKTGWLVLSILGGVAVTLTGLGVSIAKFFQ